MRVYFYCRDNEDAYQDDVVVLADGLLQAIVAFCGELIPPTPFAPRYCVGVRPDHIAATIAAQDRAWALKHCSPAALARRFLQTFTP